MKQSPSEQNYDLFEGLMIILFHVCNCLEVKQINGDKMIEKRIAANRYHVVVCGKQARLTTIVVKLLIKIGDMIVMLQFIMIVQN